MARYIFAHDPHRVADGAMTPDDHERLIDLYEARDYEMRNGAENAKVSKINDLNKKISVYTYLIRKST